MRCRLIVSGLIGLLSLAPPTSMFGQDVDSLNARAQKEVDRAREEAGPVEEPGATDAECDGDFDGAMIGTLIGGSPLILAVVLASFDEDSGEGYIAPFAAGFVGGIVGFWTGLAVDSTRCDVATPPVP